MGFEPTTLRFVEALHMLYGWSVKTIKGKVEVYERLGFAVRDVWAIFKKWPNFLGYSEKKIDDSIETFPGLGFSRDEFMMIVKHHPQCFGLSAETVKKKMFMVKQMNWPLKALVSNPQVFGLSMVKRIVPRCNVIKALISKGFLGSKLPSVRSVLMITDQAFLDKYVRNHNDKELMSELMAIFIGDRAFT